MLNSVHLVRDILNRQDAKAAKILYNYTLRAHFGITQRMLCAFAVW